MAKKEPNVCPSCGTKVAEPYKTWQLVSPIPDSKGRITVTVMGMFQCTNCGKKWRAVVSKLKVGGEGVEVETASGKKSLESKPAKKREAPVIVIDVDEEE